MRHDARVAPARSEHRLGAARFLSTGLKAAGLILLFTGVIGALIGGIVVGSEPGVPVQWAALVAGGCAAAMAVAAALVGSAGCLLQVAVACFDTLGALPAAGADAPSRPRLPAGDPDATGAVTLLAGRSTSPSAPPPFGRLLPPGVTSIGTGARSGSLGAETGGAERTPSGRIWRLIGRRANG